MAEACRNRTNLSTLPRRNNGFEDRGSHQTPFASSDREKTRTITSATAKTFSPGTCAAEPDYGFGGRALGNQRRRPCRLPHARADEKSVHIQPWVASGQAAVRDVEEAVAGVERHPSIRKDHHAQSELRIEIAFRRRRRNTPVRPHWTGADVDVRPQRVR